MAGRDTNVGAKRARELRGELGVAPESPVPALLELVEQRLGLPVIVAALPDAIAGCCWRDDAQILLWVNGTHPAVRMRFTLAHELGHVRCGHDTGIPVDTYDTLAGRTTDGREVQANAFAAELLAPKAGVLAMHEGEPTLDDVVRIAARYGLSMIAALYRLSTLGLSRRVAALQRDIDEGLARGVWERLEPERLTDAFDALDGLPRLSPALGDSALGGVVHGSVSIDAAAHAAGCDAERLADGAATMGI